jgi:gamma-glutamylcyclotransferase (GGCT)/AIG2-like uncharacterized protein YtfP
MSKLVAALFVYGTLCFPEIVGKLTGKLFQSRQAVLKGFQRKKVGNADYPAIIKNEYTEVTGILLYDVDARSMQILSFYEGEDYRCEEHLVYVKKDKISAKVFIWNSDVEDLEDDDWNPEEFLKNSFNLYLEKIIPDTMVEFSRSNK